MLLLAVIAVSSQYLVTYCPGGETAYQAMKRVGGTSVIGGGYYATAKGVRHSIDLVLIEGKVVIPYRQDLKRPVLVIEKDGDIRLDPSYAPTQDDWYALAGAKVPADPTRVCPRQIVVVNGRELKFRRITGSYKQCERKLGQQPHIYMDGGHSADPLTRLPSHIVRL